ncbi:MAG TPA: beta-propeller fold lactonase family protein [Terriglobales bacterium]|nr:beta-propeller fold lactonase family protein [Terriglobales bacterium]
MRKHIATTFIHFALLFSTSLALYAAPVVTVISPKTGSNIGSPIYYEADATSSGCTKGISAMRIYTSPGVAAFTTNGGHIETFVKLSPGTYNTVVQAWDNCGAVAKTPVKIVVSVTAGVTVFLPSGASNTTPLHIAASAQNPACGISAMRIYTAPGVAPYTINSNQLDAFVTLSPGNYNLVAQAWDKCGHVYKASIAESVGTASDKYLYTANNSFNTVSKFVITNGALKNPNGSQPPPQFPMPELPSLLGADPSGHFLYVLSDAHIFPFQVDRSTGNLFSVAGSLALTGKGLNGVSVDPAGHFLYLSYFGSSDIASYQINRSSGALTLVGTVPAGSSTANTIIGPTALTTDVTGQFVYASVASNTLAPPAQVQGFKVDSNTGKLQSLSGATKTISGSESAGTIVTSGKYLYVDYSTSQSSLVQGYTIASNGSLTAISGSPFQANVSMGDWFGRFALSSGADNNFPPDGFLSTYKIVPATGALGAPTETPTGHDIYFQLVEDHSGQFVYGGGEDCSGCTEGTNFPPGVVASWRVDSSGKPTSLSGPISSGDPNWPPNAIAVTR